MNKKITDNRHIQNVKRTAVDYGSGYKRKTITSIHRLWRSKNGSFYGLGIFFNFVFLEILSIWEAITTFEFTLANIITEIIKHIFNLGMETLQNLITAFLWPKLILDAFKFEAAIVIFILLYVCYHLVRKQVDINKLFPLPHIDLNLVHQILESKFSFDSSGKVIGVPPSQNIEAISNYTDLQKLAISKQIDGWRNTPQSCLALIVLLSCSEQNESTHQYLTEVIEEAWKHQLEEELEPIQQVYFYSIAYTQTHPTFKKKLIKKFKKLAKNDNSGNVTRYINQLNIIEL